MSRAVAIGAVTSLLLASTLVSRAEAPVNGGTLCVAANYHPGGANASEQDAIAQTHDLIVMGTGWTDTGPPAQYDESNPDMVAIVYQSWFDTGPGGVDYEYIDANHEDWFYHDADGYRIATYRTSEREDCDPRLCPSDPSFCRCRFGLDLGHPGLRDYVGERFADLAEAGGDWASQRAFDGIFMDNTFPSWPYRDAKVNNGTVTGKPVDEDGNPQSEAMWVEDQEGFIAAMRSSVGTDTVLIFNGCVASANYSTWKANSYAYLDHADGCTMENWSVSGSGTGATPRLGADWERDLDLFEGVNARGKWSTPLIGSGVHQPGVNRYGIASALLTHRGARSCMNFWKGTALEAIAGRFEETFPEAFVDLGVAREDARRLSDGTWSRDFSAGRVLVNPTSSSRTIDLGETMRTIEGEDVSSVTLASGRAEILIRDTGGEPTPPEDVRNNRRTDVK